MSGISRFGGEGTVTGTETHGPDRRPLRIPRQSRDGRLGRTACWPQPLFVRCRNGKSCNMADTNRIAAGHPDFKSAYLAGLKERASSENAPTLLLFPAKAAVAADLSEQSHADTESLVKQAIAAMEVRSSKFEALTYMRATAAT